MRELLELVLVNQFYAEVLQAATGRPVPLPRQPSGSSSPVDRIRHATKVLKDWLAVLDLAITPVMARDALRRSENSSDIAEALLRYLYLKRSKSDSDRDKADFAVSYIYRHPPPWRGRPPVVPEEGGPDLYAADMARALEFEGHLYGVLGDVPPPELPEEHNQLLREFEFLYQEVDDFRHFDQLMDSGVVQRVRGLKQAMGTSFYHPRVLARVAVYNAFFGARFDRLFAAAASEIKGFAARVQQEGASMLSRVEGDVTVQHLAEVKEEQILTQEYGGAQESFRKVSQFKKAVSKRAGSRAMAAGAPLPPQPRATTEAEYQPPPAPAAAAAPARRAAAGERRGFLDTIRAFVCAADLSAAGIVPLRSGNVVLSPAEIEAFRAEYGQEKSFRVDLANCLTEMVALHARMAAEMNEYRAKRASEYLWKPHADALTALLGAAGQTMGAAQKVLGLAEQRGLSEKAKAVSATMDKLSAQVQRVAKALQG